MGFSTKEFAQKLNSRYVPHSDAKLVELTQLLLKYITYNYNAITIKMPDETLAFFLTQNQTVVSNQNSKHFFVISKLCNTFRLQNYSL